MLDLAKRRENNRKWRCSAKGRAWRTAYLSGRRVQVSKQNSRYRATRKEELNEKNRALRRSRKQDPEVAPFWVRRKMLRDAHKRAKARGTRFDLVLDDIPAPSRCPVFGVPLNWLRSTPGADSPSLDRIVNSEGYVRGNVWVISRRANSIKHDATPRELRVVADAVAMALRDRAGADPSEWPENLRVREFPR